MELLRGTEHSDNRASSACTFRDCAPFLSAALSTAPNSAKHRSTSSCFAWECHTCVQRRTQITTVPQNCAAQA